LHFKSIISLE